MTYFLVELYLPRTGPGGIGGVTARARSVAERVLALGSDVRLVRSIFVPEDEICFELYAASSPDDVRQAASAADRRVGRIVEAVELDGEGLAATKSG
jgi:hypothetical protein